MIMGFKVAYGPKEQIGVKKEAANCGDLGLTVLHIKRRAIFPNDVVAK
jgi:hypothetical protein